MKILLFFPGGCSISDAFIDGFKSEDHDVQLIDYNKILPGYIKKLESKSGFMPFKFREKVRSKLLSYVQPHYLEKVYQEKPDLVVVYNDQMLLAETVVKIKQTGCKLAVYLADSPMFLNRRDHILKMMLKADQVFAPDSYWLEQLNMLGIEQTTFLLPGYDNKYKPVKISNEDKDKYSSDLVFVGSPYQSIWGYKRALFLNAFTHMDIKIFGPLKWERWFNEFPDLKEKSMLSNTYIPDDKMNILLNCAKIYPVDANPGLINGVHIRVFECISAGILPIVEYRKDFSRAFDGVELPVFKSYTQAPKLAQDYLKENARREELVVMLQDFIKLHYSTAACCRQLLTILF